MTPVSATELQTPGQNPGQPRLRSVMGGIFRANPGYQLVPFAQLSAAEQELFADLRNDPNLFGILRPREGSGLPVKSACLQTSLLFSGLAEPAPLPPFVAEEDSPHVNRQIAEMVLDGVLQISHGGQMIEGARALPAVCDSPQSSAPATELARLSCEALRYAQALPFEDPSLLSGRLYTWGRLPATPSWTRRMPNEAALRQCLLLTDDAANTQHLAARWLPVPPDPDNDGWLFWQSRQRLAGQPLAAFKLYLSPHPSHLREALEAMIPALEHTRANAFKIGRNLAGMLRPDKMIAYFSHFDQLQEAARRIGSTLAGCPAHGVPFTAQLSSPLLSWGADPPAERDLPPWLQRQSWRLWITNRLGVSLSQAKQQHSSSPSQSPEPWQFAMARLSLDGIDTTTWSPRTRNN